MAFRIIMRGLKQRSGPGTRTLDTEDPATGLRELLNVADFPAAEPLLLWKDNDDALPRLAALDVDWHGEIKPEPHRLDMLAATCVPQPAFAWRTHGGGLRFIFAAGERFAADELAAVAAASLFAGRRRREESYGITGV